MIFMNVYDEATLSFEMRFSEAIGMGGQIPGSPRLTLTLSSFYLNILYFVHGAGGKG